MKMDTIGSSPVTNGIVSGATTGAGEIDDEGEVGTERGGDRRRATTTPSKIMLTIKAVTDRSGMRERLTSESEGPSTGHCRCSGR